MHVTCLRPQGATPPLPVPHGAVPQKLGRAQEKPAGAHGVHRVVRQKLRGVHGPHEGARQKLTRAHDVHRVVRQKLRGAHGPHEGARRKLGGVHEPHRGARQNSTSRTGGTGSRLGGPPLGHDSAHWSGTAD